MSFGLSIWGFLKMMDTLPAGYKVYYGTQNLGAPRWAPCGAFALGGGLGGLAFGFCMDLMLSYWAWNLGVV